MTTKIFERAKVDETGHIRGLEAHKGEEFILVKAPKLDNMNFDLDKPREVVDEVMKYVREHRSLAQRQYEEFTARYGTPQEKFRELAAHLSPEEFARRTKEIADFAEKRLNDARRDVEATYAKVEKEIETRADAIMKGKKNGAVVTLDEQTAAGSVENRKDRTEREF